VSVTRLAMIGTRGHYRTVLNELPSLDPLRLVGVASGGPGDPVDPLAQWARDNGHAPRVCDDWRELFDATRPHLLVVCGPFELHARMCIEAVERGIHVLTEKPAALTRDDLAELADGCRRNPRVHLAGMMFSRYDPGFYTARQLIAAGAIGDVRLLNARKSYKLGARAAYYHDRATYGGTIPWVGSHAIDWVMWLSGHHFRGVFATHSTTGNGGHGTMEATAACHFTLCNGRAATVSIDVLRPSAAPTHGDDWIRVVGTAGVLEARPQSLQLVNAGHDGKTPYPVACDRTPVRDLVDAITGRRPGLIGTLDTLALTDACLAARASADEGRPIAIEKLSLTTPTT
jgi:predicted dehydrogenase